MIATAKMLPRVAHLLETGGRDDDKRVISKLKKKRCVLECAKMRAESEVELWKKRFGTGTLSSREEQDPSEEPIELQLSTINHQWVGLRPAELPLRALGISPS